MSNGVFDAEARFIAVGNLIRWLCSGDTTHARHGLRRRDPRRPCRLQAIVTPSQAIGCAGSTLAISGPLAGRFCRRCARFRSWRLPAGFRRAAGWPRCAVRPARRPPARQFRQDFADRRRCKDHGPSHAVGGGCLRRRRLTSKTRMPPGFSTPQERCCVSPPTVSSTTSTSCTAASKGAAE